MAQAYQCDRCKELFKGDGDYEFVAKLGQQPYMSSEGALITMTVNEFRTSTATGFISKPALCKPCRVILFELALEMLREAKT